MGIVPSSGICSARLFLILLKLIAPGREKFVAKRELAAILPGKMEEDVCILEFKVSHRLVKSLAVLRLVVKEREMSLYIGKFYFEEKDLFILIAILVLLVGWAKGLAFPFISYPGMIFLTFLFLLAKGLLIKTHESLIFIVFLSAILLLNFFPLSLVFLYIILNFFFLRLTRII